MDPEATWNALLEGWEQCNWLDVAELAEALLQWLGKNGFPPETMGTRMGADWNRVLALAACNFALQRAHDVLNSPNQIPSQVPFTLSCDTCSNEGPDTYTEAVNEGWSQIRYYPAGCLKTFLVNATSVASVTIPFDLAGGVRRQNCLFLFFMIGECRYGNQANEETRQRNSHGTNSSCHLGERDDQRHTIQRDRQSTLQG